MPQLPLDKRLPLPELALALSSVKWEDEPQPRGEVKGSKRNAPAPVPITPGAHRLPGSQPHCDCVPTHTYFCLGASVTVPPTPPPVWSRGLNYFLPGSQLPSIKVSAK